MPSRPLILMDVKERRWSFTAVAGEAMSFTEAPDGTIYFATYPTSNLYAYDPGARRLTNHGRLDPREQYPYSLVVGDDGWVYAGLGTARSNVVAFHPDSGQLRQLAAESERRVGVGTVWQGTDGALYGRTYENGPVYRLAGGEAQPSGYVPAAEGPVAIRWGDIVRHFGDGARIVAFDLPARTLQVAEGPGKVNTVHFDYASEGTQITSLVAGPDGRIYGSTSHPMHFFVYDPEAAVLTDLGHIESVGGGNFAGMAVQGEYVLGGAYAGGDLYAFDTSRPWNTAPGSQGNPRLLAAFPGPITRPRTVLAHPDGEHVLMGGFAGYGLVGGGLAIFNLTSGHSQLIPDNSLASGHSVITMRALPSGEIVLGTSVEAPGGGQPIASVAKLLVLDWQTREVTFSMEPIPNRSVFGTATIPGAREVVSLEVDSQGLVYGLASDGQFLVFDPAERSVVHRSNLGAYGKPVRADQSFFKTPDGMVYALLTQGIVRIEPGSYVHKLVAVPPDSPTAGIAYLDDVLYFAIGTHLWSVKF